MDRVGELAALLRQKKWTLAVAESCTGGLISAAITALAGVSDVYVGGVVSYANSVKEGLLDVPRALLAAHGAVSAEVAEAMVRGVCKRLGADTAIAVTGIAGPGGASAQKPVGLVYIAVLSPKGAVVQRHLFTGNRQAVQRAAASAGIAMLIEQIRHNVK